MLSSSGIGGINGQAIFDILVNIFLQGIPDKTG